MTLSEIERKRKRLEQVGSDASRSQGELDQLLKTMKTQFQVHSLPEAKKLLKKLQQEIISLEESCRELQEAFDARWGDKLGEQR